METNQSTGPESAAGDFAMTRLLNAPREWVFQAWTHAEQLTQWWGPRMVSIPVCQMDARPGSAYRIVMHIEGNGDYPIKGVVQEVTPPARLVMTMDCAEHPVQWHDMVKPGRAPEDVNPAGVMRLSAVFTEAPGGTELAIRIRFESPAIGSVLSGMGMAEGWSESLDRLAEHLERIRKAKIEAGPANQ